MEFLSILVLFPLIGIIFAGIRMILIGKGKIRMDWKEDVDIPREEKRSFVCGWIIVILGGFVLVFQIV